MRDIDWAVALLTITLLTLLALTGIVIELGNLVDAVEALAR